jgi:MFS transporter, UMF1 family
MDSYLYWCLRDDKQKFFLLSGDIGRYGDGWNSKSFEGELFIHNSGKKDTTSYFSLMDVIYKMAIVTGTFSFGLAENLTGNMRNSVLVLGVFFLLGMLFISKTKLPKWSATS